MPGGAHNGGGGRGADEAASVRGSVRVAVVIPMYREAARIGPTIADVARTAASPEAHGLAGVRIVGVYLVDDGSTDGTAAAARRAIAAVPRGEIFEIVPHGVNRGKGAAVRTGLAAALGMAGAPGGGVDPPGCAPDWVLMMDADNSARPGELRTLLGAADARGGGDGAAGGVDFVLGSRRTADADVEAALSRRAAGLVYVTMLGAMGLGLARDTQCGFKLYSARAARVMLEYSTEDRFAFDVEHVLLCKRAGLRTAEVGIAWRHVDGGTVRPVRDGVAMLRAARRIARRHRSTEIDVAKMRAPDVRAPEAGGCEVVVRENRHAELVGDAGGRGARGA